MELKEITKERQLNFNQQLIDRLYKIRSLEILRKVELMLLEWDSRNDKSMRIDSSISYNGDEFTPECILSEIDNFLNK